MAYEGDVYRIPDPRKQQQSLRVPQEQLQAVPGKRVRRRALPLQQVACFALILMTASAMIYGHVSLARLTNEVSNQQGALGDLNSEYVALKARQDQSLSLSYVEQYAQNTLGMVKLDANQVEYVEMNNPDQIEVRQTGVSLKSAMSGLTKSFSAILEYLE
ncbi:MAG: hypothetical protein AB7C89_02025 [Intestinibacillus sp.]